MTHSLASVNAMTCDRFVFVFGVIFEHSPEIAEAVWPQQPFASVEDLHQAMAREMRSWSNDRQLALICAHPDLGSQTKMAAASESEQTGAGLHSLSSEELAMFQTLNHSYRAKFGFPFILAVKTLTKAEILEVFESRLQGDDAEAEFRAALAQIENIARLRLDAIIA